MPVRHGPRFHYSNITRATVVWSQSAVSIGGLIGDPGGPGFGLNIGMSPIRLAAVIVGGFVPGNLTPHLVQTNPGYGLPS